MASSREGIPDAVKRNVRAVLLSKIGGVPLENFNKDYRSLLGDQFPYRKLGFPNLIQALQAMPDTVRFEIKNGQEYLFGIADESSFMSSFAIKAQFPEFDEKKDTRKRNRNKNKKFDQGNRSKASGDHRDSRHHGQQNQDAPFNSTRSKKYPELVGNMKGLYSIVVEGARTDIAQDVEVLFGTVGAVAERSSCGNLLFFRFVNLQHAETVIDRFNGFQIGRYKLKVEPAKEKGSSKQTQIQKGNDASKPQQQQYKQHQEQDKQQHQQQKQHQQQSGKVEGLLEEKITELNATLMGRMQKPNNNHIPMHLGNVQNTTIQPVNMINGTPMNMVQAGVHVSEHTHSKKQNFHHQQKASGANSHNQNGKYSNSTGGSREGQRSNRHQRKDETDSCSIKVSRIANSLLERDVQSFLEPYNPERIQFQYPNSSHTCYSAIVHLAMRDAERAIQGLNGKIKYDTPLSVKPYTMRRKKPRHRNTSEGSSVGESMASSIATDDAEPAKEEVDGLGGEADEEPMPSLADFAARFSNVSM